MLNGIVKFYLVYFGNFFEGFYIKEDGILKRGRTKNSVLVPSVLAPLTKLGNIFYPKFLQVII